MGDPPTGRHLWDATEACDGGLMTGLFIRKAAQTVTEMTHLADVVNGQLINRFTINIWIKINRWLIYHLTMIKIANDDIYIS